MPRSACVGCGALFEDRDGPVHRYMESSPACWAAFGQVLAREYADADYFAVHRLSVDAYAVQHPGRPSPQSSRSVWFHLTRLYFLLEGGMPMERANAVMAQLSARKQNVVWLTPPPGRGVVAVRDVLGAANAAEHCERVRTWAQSAWLAWSAHHAAIAEFAHAAVNPLFSPARSHP